ncbi:MAG TPA: MFS transporter [Candidatus Limnocylindrales bacterium]|nr:MFS transporter [Candidatus Limnocylindrales bacterium]
MTRTAWVLGAALALVLLPSNLPAAALPLLGAEWSASSAALGWVVSAYQLGYTAAVPILLPLTDRVSAPRIVAASAAVTAIASALFPLLAHDAVVGSLLRVVAGMGLAGIYMPGVRLVAASARPERRGFAIGAYVAAFYLGTALSFLVAGLLLPLGWRMAGLLITLPALLALPLAFASAAPTLEAGDRGRLDPRVLRDPPLARTVFAYAAHAWELFVSRTWTAAFLAAALVSSGLELADASASASLWASVAFAIAIPAVFLGGWWSDRVGRDRAAIVLAATSGVLSLAIGFLLEAPFAALMLLVCVHAAFIGSDSAVYSTAVTELSPRGRLGSAQAVQALAGFGMGAVGPVVAGAALDVGLSWPGVFATGGVLSLLGAAALAYGRRSRAE